MSGRLDFEIGQQVCHLVSHPSGILEHVHGFKLSGLERVGGSRESLVRMGEQELIQLVVEVRTVRPQRIAGREHLLREIQTILQVVLLFLFVFVILVLLFRRPSGMEERCQPSSQGRRVNGREERVGGIVSAVERCRGYQGVQG